MQLQRIELKKLGTTERILRSDTQGNFDKLENAVNSNAGTTEAWYKQLSSNLAAENANRQADDTAEAQARAEADKELDGKINQSEDRLGKRITAIERILFGESPQEVKMADNSTPPLANGGAMLINLTSKEDK